MTLHGIPNCTTVKKARTWLAEQGHEVAFHDFKKSGVDAAWLKRVVAQTGWQALLNTRGTTWRGLSPAEQATAGTEAGALALMQAKPSLIKRPVLERGDQVVLGFSDAQYHAVFHS